MPQSLGRSPPLDTQHPRRGCQAARQSNHVTPPPLPRGNSGLVHVRTRGDEHKKRRSSFGSSVAHKTIRTVLSQRMQREDNPRVGHQRVCSGPAAVRNRRPLDLPYMTTEFTCVDKSTEMPSPPGRCLSGGGGGGGPGGSGPSLPPVAMKITATPCPPPPPHSFRRSRRMRQLGLCLFRTIPPVPLAGDVPCAVLAGARAGPCPAPHAGRGDKEGGAWGGPGAAGVVVGGGSGSPMNSQAAVGATKGGGRSGGPALHTTVPSNNMPADLADKSRRQSFAEGGGPRGAGAVGGTPPQGLA